MRTSTLDQVVAAMLGLVLAFVLVQVVLLLARRRVARGAGAASPTWVYLSKLTSATRQRYFIAAGVAAFVPVAAVLLLASR